MQAGKRDGICSEFDRRQMKWYILCTSQSFDGKYLYADSFDGKDPIVYVDHLVVGKFQVMMLSLNSGAMKL
jgi:hypothetical protein